MYFPTDPRVGEPASYPGYPPRVDVPFTSSIGDGYNPAHHNPHMNLLGEIVHNNPNGGAPMTTHLAQPGTGPTEFPSHSAIKVEQGSYPVHGGGLSNGMEMGTGVMPPPVLQDVVSHSVGPSTMVDSPMQEVPAQAENQIHPCISELLSSPHMLPCKPLTPCSSGLMLQFTMKTCLNLRKSLVPPFHFE